MHTIDEYYKINSKIKIHIADWEKPYREIVNLQNVKEKLQGNLDNDFEDDYKYSRNKDRKENKSYGEPIQFLSPTTMVSHYTTLETFYNIVKTDSLWATHARFSNDDEELHYAQENFNKILIYKISEQDECSYKDAYIVSLCADDDLLSQWRGYCNKQEGVSISFDFGNMRPFYLISGSEKSDPFYNCAQPIIYGKNQLRGFLLTIQDNNNNLPLRNLSHLLPFVKHPSFSEEMEYRLTATNDPSFDNKYVKYRSVGQVQIPYVEIKTGLPKRMRINKGCVIRVNLKNQNDFDEFKEKFAKCLLWPPYTPSLIDCKNMATPYDDMQCFGCSMRQIDNSEQTMSRCGYMIESYTTFEKNVIMISEGNKQQKIFNIVSEIVDEINKANKTNNEDKIKVWCEGHLPIRKIRVGNTRRKKELKESIEHFCKHGECWWLKYVDVRESNIPFRSPLKFD